jgi:hypothetical protein
MESGKIASKAEGVKFIRMSEKGALFQVGSGNYQFSSTGYEKYIVENTSIPATKILPNSCDLTANESVSIVSNTEGATIRYTLNGTEPTENSKEYTGPFTLEKSCDITARSYIEGMEPGYLTRAHMSVYDEEINGVHYAYYEGKWNAIPDFNALIPKQKGTITNFRYNRISVRENNWGARFQSWIDIPKDGMYTFYSGSDDGSRLYIDHKLVVDNDGLHGQQEQAGEIELTQGRYPIVVDYIQGGNDMSLKISWEGPGMPKQRLGASLLFKKGN